MNRCNPNLTEYATYLQSIIRLDALEKMTQDLDKELADSQKLMRDIKAIFESVPKAPSANESVNNGLSHEDKLKFLEDDVPKLLLPDMVENITDIDLDDIISKMKGYAEELKKNLNVSPPQNREPLGNTVPLDLVPYVSSLDQLSKRLANLKINKGDGTAIRNPELESKLGQLCQDVDMLTKMGEAETALNECNMKWKNTLQNNNALQYDNIINKLLSGINEVSYLLQNKN